MDFQKILTINGKPGLFRLLNSNSASIIVESLIDGKRMPVHAAHKISSLEDISIYTMTEDVPLSDIFTKIQEKENGGNCLEASASDADRRAYMLEIMPEYDAERVYNSDLKKLFRWYNTLNELNLITADETTEKEEDSPVVEDAEIIEESTDTSDKVENEQ